MIDLPLFLSLELVGRFLGKSQKVGNFVFWSMLPSSIIVLSLCYFWLPGASWPPFYILLLSKIAFSLVSFRTSAAATYYLSCAGRMASGHQSKATGTILGFSPIIGGLSGFIAALIYSYVANMEIINF